MSRHHSYDTPKEADISDQFQGMEIEFNDKVTLFPVQVERADTPLKNRSSKKRDSEYKRSEVGSW